jgi:hypothetical protein
MKLSIIATILAAALVAAPGGCERPTKSPEPERSTAAAPAPAVPAPGTGALPEGEVCPPTTVLKFVGVVHDPTDALVHRPVQMSIDQFTQTGNVGTVHDQNGQDAPGVGFTRTGLSPMTYCLRSTAIGSVITAQVSFQIQTNLQGYIIECHAYAAGLDGRFTLIGADEDEIGDGATIAVATCSATWFVKP